MDDLLINTVTISTRSSTNSGGDVSDNFAPLYTNIKGRIFELSNSDLRFIESRKQYSDVVKKCFIQGDKTGVKDGDRLVCDGITYMIVHVKTLQDSTEVHHFELYLSLTE